MNDDTRAMLDDVLAAQRATFVNGYIRGFKAALDALCSGELSVEFANELPIAANEAWNELRAEHPPLRGEIGDT